VGDASRAENSEPNRAEGNDISGRKGSQCAFSCGCNGIGCAHDRGHHEVLVLIEANSALPSRRRPAVSAFQSRGIVLRLRRFRKELAGEFVNEFLPRGGISERTAVRWGIYG
jgi:hypothetical protein